MRNYHLRRSSKWCKSINIEQLFTLLPEETRQKYAKDKSKAVVIDVVRKVIIPILNHYLQTLLEILIRFLFPRVITKFWEKDSYLNNLLS